MVATRPSRSEAVRARLNHPIIDADGHTQELTPVVLDYVEQIGGSKMLERHSAALENLGKGYRMFSDERRYPVWWTRPTKSTIDRATAYLPRLLHQRMDELGMDFTVVFPSAGLLIDTTIQDEELRRVTCRAFNTFHADIFREYSDRMTPVGIVTMHTPQEAIEELEYAVKVLGLKAIMIAGYVRRPISGQSSDADRLDTYGIDSEYDYDPFWAKCLELKVAPTSHSIAQGLGFRRSPSNSMYNHIGHFAAAGEALCKSLFMGGVTRRFPSLKFAFLEGGVSWGCGLYADMIGHWEKRNPKALMENLDPRLLDHEMLMGLISEYGHEKVVARLGEIRDSVVQLEVNVRVTDSGQPTLHEDARQDVLDEWAPCRIETAEDIRDLFVPRFYFGCEADDPLIAWAFNTKINPFGARLHPILSSDIGHWDVPDMREVIAEAYELVEKEVVTEEDFQDFMFTNPVTLHGGMNPDFFKGTPVEAAASRILSQGDGAAGDKAL